MRFFASLNILLLSASAHALTPKEVYDKSGPAVVLILASDDGRTGQGGTGSIVDGSGRVLTNGHVVLNESGVPFKTIYVFLKPAKVSGDNSQDLKQRYTARVVKYSPPSEMDLAVLQIDQAPADLPVMPIGRSEDVSIGDPVVAIGHPEQGGLWTLTTGTISTVVANFDRIKGKNVFQTEASFNRGNSGGPLLDAGGNMIGVNTMIARKAADGMAITAVNFSLKSQVAMDWLHGTAKMQIAYTDTGAPTGTKLASNDAPPVEATPPPKAGKKPKPVATKPLPEQPAPAQQAPKIVTEKRPYKIDSLLQDQMREMEDMMDDMHQKVEQSRRR